ncbi:MAG: fluoride efflux transporter CrcB [Bacteroidota bacterium]
MNWLAVFLGGGLGSLARYGISLLVLRTARPEFPVATLMANALSCVVMGAALWYAASRWPEGHAGRLFLLVGFCGGFSTFSTFSLETLSLMRSGHVWAAALNVLISVAICISVLYLLTKSQST